MHTRRREGGAGPRTVAVLGVVAVLALAGCDAMRPRVDRPAREYVRMPPPPLDSLRAAPETIAVDDVRIAAGAVLGMNLMPGPSAYRSTESSLAPLGGRVDIHPADTTGATTLPAGLALQGAWLRAGDSIWALGMLPSDTTRAGSTGLALDVHGGPAWLGRDSRVDVVVRVRRPDGASRLVQVRGVRVQIVS